MKQEVSPEVLGIEFLHRQNTRLHISPEVEGAVLLVRSMGEQVSQKPVDKITAYLGFLANSELGNDGILTGDEESIKSQVDSHIAKPENAPDSFFELRRRINREQGRGDRELTPDEKAKLVEEAQDNQRTSLGAWGNYLGQNDANFPDWFKTYTWNSVTKLNDQVNSKNEFNRRNKQSMQPFPLLNGQALAYVYDYLDSSLTGKDDAYSEDLKSIVQAGSFNKLYGYAMNQIGSISPEEKNIVEGSWIRYDQTPDITQARKLSESLQPYATGWCTAGLKTAHNQLTEGDFYVYYTKNTDGDEVVPRIAIRMADEEVEEVRGILAEQELEPAMISIVTDKLDELPGGEKYQLKVEDMRQLTAIEKALEEDSEAVFTDEQLRFLFEVEHTIENFGYGSDPRIDELQNKITQDIRPAFAQGEFSQFLLKAPDKFSFFTDLGCEDFSDLYETKLADIEGKPINAPEIILKNIDSFKGLDSDAALKLFRDFNPIDVYQKTDKFRMFKNLDRRVLAELKSADHGEDMYFAEISEDELEILFPNLTREEIREEVGEFALEAQDFSVDPDELLFDMDPEAFERRLEELASHY